MPQTLYRAYQAILQGLIDEAHASAAVLVLGDGLAERPHILAQVGHLTAAEWAGQLKAPQPDIFIQPLASTTAATALLAVQAEDQSRWSKLQQTLIRAAAHSIEHLSRSGGAEIDWGQLVASQRILPVTEEELCRIVLDIHDGPVQKIFAALNHVIHLQHLAQQGTLTDTSQTGMCGTNLDKVGQLLEGSLTEIRTFLGAFRPPEFNERPLLDVLEDLIIQHEELTDATVHLEVETELPPVNPSVKIAFYRILQEALSNSIRHAGVDENFVRLWAQEDDIYLEVVDFGRGFEPPDLTGPGATERAEHIGLRGMRERVQLVGGSITLFSQPDQGTQIEVRVPRYG